MTSSKQYWQQGFPYRKVVRSTLPAACLASMLMTAARAQEATTNAVQAATDLSLEQLVNLQVTSVSKKEEKLNDAAAAITVLSNDDIRRSGATSIAEALRWVPGLNVGVDNASDWSISSRGFSSLYGDKLLVLVDGRTVYTPIFAGVFWDLQQMNLADVDRVEVIRGPGGTMWGANAMNGVINIVSKSARDTQGGYFSAGGGDVHLTSEEARYGGKLGENTYYRVDGGYSLTDDYPLANGRPGGDGWQSEHGGFRIDHYPSEATHLTWQADTVVNQLNEHTSSSYNVNTLGRWDHTISDSSSVEVQAYYDRTYRDDISRMETAVDTFDLTAQHTFSLGLHNDFIWGGGYRFAATELQQIPNTGFFALQDHTHQQLFSVFLQDQFKPIPDRLTFTAGVKVEHNDYTGFEFQPSVTATFKPAENQTLWASISRAVRTPDEDEAANNNSFAIGAPMPGPGGGLYLPTVVGDGHPASEVLWAYELGYRIQPVKQVNVDVTGFYNDYSGLISPDLSRVSFIPGTPIGTAAIPWSNTQHGHTFGGEASLTYAPMDTWRLTATYSFVQMSIAGVGFASVAPQHQVMLRSAYDITKQLELNAQLRYVDQLPSTPLGNSTTPQVPAYFTADAQLVFRPNKNLEFALVGQNLFSPRHQEQPGGIPGSIFTEAPRGFYGKVTWHF